MFKISKRFISFNGLSYLNYHNNYIRLGNDTTTQKYYSIIDNYKSLEIENKALINLGRIRVNPSLNRYIAKDILEYRISIQKLQFAAIEHFIYTSEGLMKKVTKELDRKKQLQHEYIIHLYTDFLELPKEEFIYYKLF